MKKVLFTLTVIALSLSYTLAQEIIYPTDDMTVNAGTSTMFPASDQLWISDWAEMQNHHQTMFKFDLSAYSGQTLANATLKIFQYFHAPDGSPTPAKIYAITETWDESSWPENTNISHSATEYATVNFTATTGWYEIDITNLVNEWLEGGITNNGLIIVANPNTKFAQFYSKETSDETHKPRIELNLTNGINETLIVDFDVYPNPATSYVNVSLNIDKPGKIQINILDILGQTIKTVSSLNTTGSLYKKTINCNDLNKGIYFIQIELNNQTYNRKLIIE